MHPLKNSELAVRSELLLLSPCTRPLAPLGGTRAWACACDPWDPGSVLWPLSSIICLLSLSLSLSLPSVVETGEQESDSREATRPGQHRNDTTKKLQKSKLRSASAPNLGRRMFHCCCPPPTAAWGLHESRTESRARGPSGRRSCLALLAGAAQSCCAGSVVSGVAHK